MAAMMLDRRVLGDLDGNLQVGPMSDAYTCLRFGVGDGDMSRKRPLAVFQQDVEPTCARDTIASPVDSIITDAFLTSRPNTGNASPCTISDMSVSTQISLATTAQTSPVAHTTPHARYSPREISLKADLLKTRLRLGWYKVVTGQESTPFAQLRMVPVSMELGSPVSVGAKRRDTSTHDHTTHRKSPTARSPHTAATSQSSGDKHHIRRPLPSVRSQSAVGTTGLQLEQTGASLCGADGNEIGVVKSACLLSEGRSDRDQMVAVDEQLLTPELLRTRTMMPLSTRAQYGSSPVKQLMPAFETPGLPRLRHGLMRFENESPEKDLTSSVVKGRAADGLMKLMAGVC